MTNRSVFAWGLSALIVGVLAGPVPASGFRLGNPPTLRDVTAEAQFIVYGTLSNPRLTDGHEGLTDLTIEQSIRADPSLTRGKVIVLPRYIPVDGKGPTRFMVLGKVVDGKPEVTAGLLLNPAAVRYLKSALAYDPRDPVAALLFFARHIDSTDADVASDAYRELRYAAPDHLVRAAKCMEPGRLRKLVADRKTPPERVSLFAYLLGICGGERDAEIILRVIVRKLYGEDRYNLDGLYAGYIRLRPREGWELVSEVLYDTKRSFSERYAAFNAITSLGKYQPDVVDRDKLAASLARVAEDDHLADLAVEELRKWGRWETADSVLALYDRKSHDIPIVRRAILRFAISHPTGINRKVDEFVREARRQDPELADSVSDMLWYEAEKLPPPRSVDRAAEQP